MAEKLIVVRTLDQLDALRDYLEDKEFVAYDTETTGLSRESSIIGFSVSAEVDTGYYVVLRQWNTNTQALDTTELEFGVAGFLHSLRLKKLLMHNATFDCAMTKNNYGVELMPSLHTDTMILAHLLDENRACGLKELAVSIFGEDSAQEQAEMKASISANGGSLTRANYELYKADSELIARYGAKDTILTLKLFYHLVPDLYEQGLDRFFYEEEAMPLLKGPTYELNTTGLRIAPDKLQKLKQELQADCLDAKAFIHKEIDSYVKDKYPGTGKTNHFNIGSGKQLAWLLFERLEQDFHLLTKEGKNLCKFFGGRLPYALADKRAFITSCKAYKAKEWQQSVWNPKTKKMSRPKKVGDYWNYLACGKETLTRFAKKYKWVERFLKYAKDLKLLNTYVEGIQSRMKYNIIRPSFLQHGTTSGRYSSRNPNFQNLPRDDKRVKSCIEARPGNVFVGADYSQLEPRVFASFSGDERLMACFANGDDFYSVVGAEAFDKYDCTLKKDDKNSFANKYPELRQIAKVIALSATYGTTAPKMAPAIDKSIQEAQQIIDSYFEKFPSVKQLMLDSHEQAKSTGQVVNLFGRPRRIPRAMDIPRIYKKAKYTDLPYEARNLLNLSINHRIQSTAASIMNRAAIKCWQDCRTLEGHDPAWANVKIVMQVHDELILEGPEALAEDMAYVLKNAMETAVELPGVALVAEPKIASNIADLK